MNEFNSVALMVKLAFSLFALSAIFGALYLFFTKNILYGAYGLLLTLISLSGIYVLAGAEFIAVSQIMIYVGGILILLIFGIMLSSKKGKRTEALKVENVNNLPALFLALILGTALIYLNLHLDLEGDVTVNFQNTLKPIGVNLMTKYVLLLEIIGLLLLIALIGASYIAKKD